MADNSKCSDERMVMLTNIMTIDCLIDMCNMLLSKLLASGWWLCSWLMCGQLVSCAKQRIALTQFFASS